MKETGLPGELRPDELRPDARAGPDRRGRLIAAVSLPDEPLLTVNPTPGRRTRLRRRARLPRQAERPVVRNGLCAQIEGRRPAWPGRS
ncbi:MAG TPA: hypothetical protein VLX31_05435 [Streptosporangiaceae bacterium]|nr:hypothetical protein [Streptosporangiaceae bacterium]